MRIRLVLMLLAMALIIACDRKVETAKITYTNETQLTLKVQADGTKIVLRPGESEGFLERESLFLGQIRAYDEDGQIRYKQDLTWDQLKANGFKITIVDNVSP